MRKESNSNTNVKEMEEEIQMGNGMDWMMILCVL